MLITIYYIISFIVLIKAAIVLGRKKLSFQSYFFFFLFINFGVDFLSELDIITSKSIQYNYLNVFNIFYFTYFYYLNVKSKRMVIGMIIITLIGVFFNPGLFYLDKYSLSFALLYCTTNIIQVLYWYKYKLNNINESKITDDPAFWISSSILLWSCFFIFRTTPMYLLNEIDKPFLHLLKQLLNVINIISSVLFYIALHKYNMMNKK